MNIIHFNQIKKDDIEIVGGKGLALGLLFQAGFSVPEGFVITTKAYKEFYNQELPLSFTEEVNKAFLILGTERVAVRSSAIAEDSLTASWAGQLDSYLNISKENLLENIKKCWDSINSSQAKLYAKQQNVTEDKLLIAVVVQKMVNSQSSGVIFTQNPITINGNEIVIEACYGLCELLVQGVITPDNFIVAKDTLIIKNYILHKQKYMLVYKEYKQVQVSLPNELKEKPSISKVQVKNLATLAKKIENYFGSPQDIEWAIENEKIYIVQSRPITTLS